MRRRLVLSILFTLMATSAFAAPDVRTIVQRMKEVFEPTRPSIRKVEILVRGPNGEKAVWAAREARAQLADGKRTLLVIQEPESTRGDALLIWEREGQPNAMWWYSPVIRRVRELVPVEAYQSLLDTDLTYADLGYVDQQGTYHLLGEEEHNGEQTYKLEFSPDQKVFYSRIITWVAVDTMLPVQRDYYDLAGRLWKTMTFDQVKTIDGIPTPLHICVHDVQRDTDTDVTFSEVRYDVQLSDTLFDPEHLPQTVEVRWLQPRDTRLATEE